MYLFVFYIIIWAEVIFAKIGVALSEQEIFCFNDSLAPESLWFVKKVSKQWCKWVESFKDYVSVLFWDGYLKQINLVNYQNKLSNLGWAKFDCRCTLMLISLL